MALLCNNVLQWNPYMNKRYTHHRNFATLLWFKSQEWRCNFGFHILSENDGTKWGVSMHFATRCLVMKMLAGPWRYHFFRTRCICYHINCKFHNMTDLTDFPLDLILAEAIESKIASHLSDASYEGRPPFCGLEENVQTFSHHRWTLAAQKSSEGGEKHILSFSRTMHRFLCRFCVGRLFSSFEFYHSFHAIYGYSFLTGNLNNYSIAP